MNKATIFRSGDEVTTIDDEQDIELIPAGTKITLSHPNPSSHPPITWHGVAWLYGQERDVHVYAHNLRHA